MKNYRGNLLGLLMYMKTFRLVWFIVRGEKKTPREGANIFSILSKRYLSLASCV